MWLGKKTTSKKSMSGGSLTCWHCTINQFSVKGKVMDCGYCFCSILTQGITLCYSGSKCPFKIIVNVECDKNKKFCYTPCSDFHVALGGLAYLLVEVQSDKSQYNEYWMLLQAACVVWLGYKLHKKPSIIMALYIEDLGKVRQYFVFQCDGSDPKVLWSRLSFFIFPCHTPATSCATSTPATSHAHLHAYPSSHATPTSATEYTSSSIIAHVRGQTWLLWPAPPCFTTISTASTSHP